MNTTIEKITPNMAQKYLERNINNNRTISARRVNNLIHDMVNDKWQLNGESIKFNKRGELVDGQHRLTAIVKSGKTIEMNVVRDVDNNVYLFDKGNLRSTAQALKMAGYDSGVANNGVVGAVKLYYRVMNGSDTYVSDTKVEEFILENYDTLFQAHQIAARFSGSRASGRIATGSAPFILACFSAINAGENVADLTKFCEIVNTGFYDAKNQTAAVVCRNDILSRSIDSGTGARAKTLHQVEKALYDFCRRNARRISYAAWDKPVYTKKEDEE